MSQRTLGRVAITSLMLGIATIGCTPNASHPAALGESSVKAPETAASQADKARAALAQKKGAAAVSAAEGAVGLAPNDAGYRMLLGQSYLAAGRFVSAETSFRDTLALNADQSKARFDLALAQIGQGRGGEALPALRSLAGVVPDADLGLALTLAGDHEAGIRMLIEAARSPASTPRVRQNLALAYGIDGHWAEARAIAMQDTRADRLSEQMTGWAALAGPNAGKRQIAAMLGVTPAADAGLPARLALAVPTPAEKPVSFAAADPVAAPALLAAPVASPDQIAKADPAPLPANPVSAPPVVETAPAAPMMLARQDQPAPLPAAAPAIPALLVKPVLPAVKPATPVMLAVAHQPAATPMLLRASPAVIRHAVATMPVSSHGTFAVQLGAFRRTDAVQDAWSRLSHVAPSLAGYSPSQAQFTAAGMSFSRLSITGFATHEEAARVCQQIKAHGSKCFVRAVAGDAPLEWAHRDTGMQVASR